MPRLTVFTPLIALHNLLGCSSQADPSYQGEPLATVYGTVETADVEPSSELDAAIVWADFDKGIAGPFDQGHPAARVRVKGTFPADFTMEILEPPVAKDGAVGLIAAIPRSTGNTVTPDDLSGASWDAMVIYAAHDGDPNDPDDLVMEFARYYEFPPTKGFHLVHLAVTEKSEAAYIRCQHQFLCEHQVGGLDANQQAEEDERFELCTKYLPDTPTCTSYRSDLLTPEQQAENVRCAALSAEAAESFYRAYTDKDRHCPSPATYVAAPNFDYPVTITLGSYSGPGPVAVSEPESAP